MSSVIYSNTKVDGEYWTASDVEAIETGFDKIAADIPSNLLADIGSSGGAVEFVSTTDTQTLTNKTLTTPTITLKQAAAPAPTAEGDIQWDTDDFIVVGNGVGQTIIPSTVSEHTLTNKTLASPKVTTSVLDANGNELLKVTATGSAVNELTLVNAATGNGPTLSATGDDTNIDINITPKGTGEVNLSKVDIDAGTIDGTTQASGTINGSIAAGGTWTAAATWTLPAFTLGGTVSLNGQSFSGTCANGGTFTTIDIDGGSIDGTTIGANAAAAGTFTAFTSTGIDDNASSTAITITSSNRVDTSAGISNTGQPIVSTVTGSAFIADRVGANGTISFSYDGVEKGLIQAGSASGLLFYDVPNAAVMGTWTSTSLAVTGALSCTGALSKGSGSFKIDHPLKPDTHHLVHSFTESPRADLIYRGTATLSNGSAVVNIDDAAGMTEGTFVALCRDVQCFTSNESDWSQVRGSVSGNLLTIECQDPISTATVSWLVIGERQDAHMYATDWTDENGRVIVEPKKVQP